MKLLKTIKEVLLIIVITLSLTPISYAHLAHYKDVNKIEMEIIRNGKIIGYNFYFFKRNNNELIVTNQFLFKVKILGATVFKVEGYGEEKYLNEKLISYNSKTLQNDKRKYVNLLFNKKNNNFDIKGSSYTGKANSNNIIGSWWNHKILQATSQISPVSGSVKNQIVTFVGKENIEQYGKTYEVEHFKLNSKDTTLPEDKKLDFDIWYDNKIGKIIRVSYSRMGNWEYRLKSFD